MRLSRPAFLDDESERELRIVDDLLVLEEIEEAIVGHILLGAVAGAAAEQNRQTDQGKSDREEDDAAPIKVRVAASLVVFLRITIWLSHRRMLRLERRERESYHEALAIAKEQDPGRRIAPISCIGFSFGRCIFRMSEPVPHLCR